MRAEATVGLVAMFGYIGKVFVLVSIVFCKYLQLFSVYHQRAEYSLIFIYLEFRSVPFRAIKWLSGR